MTCPICGEDLAQRFAYPRLVGGWRVCSHHKVYIKPSRFESRCHFCLGPIGQGDEVLLCKHGESWVVLHPAGHCESVAAPPQSNGPFAQLHLTDDAPWPVVVAAYSALVTHPRTITEAPPAGSLAPPPVRPACPPAGS